MPGQKSPVHDRFLIVDGTVWVLGASLNEFGSRGTLLMKLPATPETGGSSAFSVRTNVFEVHWAKSDLLAEWVERRATLRTKNEPPKGEAGTSGRLTFVQRAGRTKAALAAAIRSIHEVWRA
jgi:hypothetical protein